MIKAKSRGFTLTELMISVAIAGLLASVGYPIYTDFMGASYRSAGQSDLIALAAAMERHKAATFSYGGAATAGGNTGAPSVYHTHSPASEPSAKKKYDLAIQTVSANGNSFTLTATPVSGTLQDGDGTLYYFSDGRKAWDQNSNGSLSASEYCWAC